MIIAVMDITSLCAAECAKKLSFCRPALLSHFQKAKNAELFHSRVGAYLLAVTLYREAAGGDAPDFYFSADGRPSFAGEKQPEISLSHDGKLVAAVIAEASENVGIDLQAEPDRKTADRIRVRFPTVFEENPQVKILPCSVDPIFYIVDAEGRCRKRGTPPLCPTPDFSLYWTRAEAIRKLKGEEDRFLGVLPKQVATAGCQSLSFSANGEFFTLTVAEAIEKTKSDIMSKL